MVRALVVFTLTLAVVSLTLPWVAGSPQIGLALTIVGVSSLTPLIVALRRSQRQNRDRLIADADYQFRLGAQPAAVYGRFPPAAYPERLCL